jgi:hypothetical protein
MPGSTKSGKQIESGRTNRAENRTRIWAQRDEDKDFFDGEAIFTVESARDIEDDDFSQVEDTQKVHGIMGSGCGAGTGVVGFSRKNPIFGPGEELSNVDLDHMKAVGVFGKGITGVVGQGDSHGVSGVGEKLPAGWGAGVIGRGGKGLVGTPGVMGFSGGVEEEFGSEVGTGVFGQGSIGVTGQGTSDAGVKGTGGEFKADETGTTGVIGFGGKGRDKNGNPRQGTGVVGVGSGDALFPPFTEPLETGVYGMGRDGVKGMGKEGVGGRFESMEDRGGVFSSGRRAAQIRLVPLQQDTPDPMLPARGKVGDLIVVRNTAKVVDERGNTSIRDDCTLWLCVPSDPSTMDSNKWQQILLGSVKTGTL